MSTWKEYYEASKYQNMPEPDQKKGVPQPPLQMPYDPNAPLFDLPDPKSCKLEQTDFLSIAESRETRRVFTEQKLTLAELSYLLWITQGVKQVTETKTRRMVPSAGSRHPFETFLLINRVEDLAQGLYRYLALEHKLLLVDASADVNQRLTEACQNQKHVQTSAITFCWVTDFARTYWRYGERAFRYVLLDAGHVCQNLYLAAETIHCGVCAIAAFDDDRVNAVLGVDGVHQFAVYLAVLGKRA